MLLREAMEHSLILAVGVWFLQRFDVTKKSLHERLDRLALGCLRLGLETREPELAAFQFVALMSLRFLNLGNSRACAFPPPLAVLIPFHVVVTIRKHLPVVTARVPSGDRAEAPLAPIFTCLRMLTRGTDLS